MTVYKADNIGSVFKLKSKIILALIVVFISGTVCNAAPADPTPREVKQADGTVITIRSYGDEFFMWSENMGGYVIAYDCENKNWCYALIDGDSLVPSSLIVGNGDIAQPWMLKYNDIKPLINRVVGSVKIYPENTT